MTNPNNSSFNSYLPTSVFLNADLDQLTIRLQAYLREVSLKVNIRQLGFYEEIETPAGQEFFSVDDASQRRNSFRKVFQFGTILAGGTLIIPHGITNVSIFTHIYGAAKLLTIGNDAVPIPHADVTNVTNQVSVEIIDPDIVINNGATATDIEKGIIVLEYLKN